MQALKTVVILIEKYNLSQDIIDTIELEISCSDSIDKFIQEFKNRLLQTDILINNAGVAINSDDFNIEIVKYTFITKSFFNYTIKLTSITLIITIGSSAGKTIYLKSEDHIKRFKNPDITRADQFKLAEEFQNHAKNNTYEQNGWPSWELGISKLLINTSVKILTQNGEIKKKNLQFYICCPG